jgi:hypothetical protein
MNITFRFGPEEAEKIPARFCLTARIAALAGMTEGGAARLCGSVIVVMTTGWVSVGADHGKLGFHGGKIELGRPRVRARDGGEIALPSWEAD